MDRARMLMVSRVEAARLHSTRGSSKSFALPPCGRAAPDRLARTLSRPGLAAGLTVTQLGDSLQIPLQPLHSAC